MTITEMIDELKRLYLKEAEIQKQIAEIRTQLELILTIKNINK